MNNPASHVSFRAIRRATGPRRVRAPAKRTLDTLPTEVIEHIALCGVFSFSEFDRYRILNFMSNFRLVSRTICAKTQHVFARQCFGVHEVDFSLEGLEELYDVSRHPAFGPAVRKLSFRSREIQASELDDMRRTISEGGNTAALQEELNEILADVQERAYVETTGAGTALLSRALQSLPNVSSYQIEQIPRESAGPRYDPHADGTEGQGSTTILVSAILAAAATASTRLRSIVMPFAHFGGPYDGYDAYAVTALARIPGPHFSKFEPLEEFELKLRACSVHGWEPLEDFLLALPSLKRCYLVADSDPDPIPVHSVVMREFFVAKPHGSLVNIHIEGFTFTYDSTDLSRSFLAHHGETLSTIEFVNCQLVQARWVDVFEALKRLTNLRTLVLEQIFQDRKWVSFDNQGFIRTSEIDTPGGGELNTDRSIAEEQAWVYVENLRPDLVQVEEWEHMQTRLRALQDDCHVNT